MKRLLARALVVGDEVAVLAPASGIRDQAALQRGLDRWRAWGFVPTLMPHALKQTDWPGGCPVAASDVERCQDLQEALANSRYRAVVCARGGYGGVRLLPELDLTVLRDDAKPILGYSDITGLLAAAYAETGLVGFHGPMVATTEAMDPGVDGWQLQRSLLTDATQPVALPVAKMTRALCVGTAEGPLIGGNLSLVQSLIGTRWQLQTAGALLFLEDTGEPPYRVDRMLTQLLQTGALSQAAGVILGDFHMADTPLASSQTTMVAVLAERLAHLNIPVAYGFPIGHRPGSWTLPFGTHARLHVPEHDAPVTLELLEASVRS